VPIALSTYSKEVVVVEVGCVVVVVVVVVHALVVVVVDVCGSRFLVVEVAGLDSLVVLPLRCLAEAIVLVVVTVVGNIC